MLSTSALIERLTTIWWSPLPGPAYRDAASGRGIGNVAWKNPGAFNLFWLISRLPHPSHPEFVPHLFSNVSLWQQVNNLSGFEVAGYPLAEQAVFLSPQEFSACIDVNLHSLKGMPPLGRTAFGPVTDPKGFSTTLHKALAACRLPR